MVCFVMEVNFCVLAYSKCGCCSVVVVGVYFCWNSDLFVISVETIDVDLAGLSVDDILKKVWDSIENAYEFYRGFGKLHGFGVRKGDSGKDCDGNVVRYRFFCNKEGLRERKHYDRVDRTRVHKPETRTNCKAMLSVYFDKNDKHWKVRKLVTEHNHDLTPVGMVHLIANHRRLTKVAKTQIAGMQAHGIATSKIVGYMAGTVGGYSMLGFLKKDVYNYADKMRRIKVADGDANSALVYLEGKAESDPMAIAKYNVTSDNRLANLIWANGSSRVDYQFFGDVLAFDSTYRKNKYKRPVVIFSGSNNHKHTTIFGFGLLLDESLASYRWMLENLMEIMCRKKPSVVVTDGDKAMIKVVSEVLPESTHRLCAWHVEKNVTSNVKDDELRGLFRRWLYADMATDVFESEWEQVAEDYGLGQKQWWCQMYEKKEMWASSYLRDKFCAGYRTTSRCEGINAYVNKFSKSTHTIFELVQCLEMVAREYRNKEMLLQFQSINSVPVMTTCLRSLERHAASVYTREVFGDIKKEIEGVGALILISRRRIMNSMIYTLEEYEEPDVHIMSSFGRSTGKLSCQCNFWKKHGYPCKHMFFVMKAEHLKEIPDNIVLRRWRTDAKSAEQYTENWGDYSERGVILRHGALHSASQWLFFLGAQRLSIFQKTMRGIESLCKELEMDCRAFGSSMHRTEENVREANPVVRDPVIAKTKGAPKIPKKKALGKRRRCTGCKGLGHTKRNCPDRGAGRQNPDQAEECGGINATCVISNDD
nr:protein FAR1-RELATED SEQUENCE 5-like [Arachis hypogaea]